MVIVGVYLQGESYALTGETEFMEPLGLEYVLAQGARMGHRVSLETLLDQDEQSLIRSVVAKAPDVIALAAMSCQLNRSLAVMGEIKKRLPKAYVVAGGYGPTGVDDPQILSNPAVDCWVAGEGEETFAEILRVLTNGKDPVKERVPGLLIQEEARVVRLPRARTENLDSFGTPWRDPAMLRRLREFGLFYPEPGRQTGFASTEHSRGCLGNCPFCASPVALGCQVTFRSTEQVCEEIKYLYYDCGINTIFFSDLDFIQRQKSQQDKVWHLCKALQALNIPVYWECLGRIRSVTATGDFALLDEMARAGCRKIGWGLESLDPKIAEMMRKGHGGADDETYQVLARAEAAGILNTAFIIIGWHDFTRGIGDTRESILQQAALLPRYPVHRIRITIGTPLPGSDFYRDCVRNRRLTTGDMDLFDTIHLVYHHPSLTASDLEKLREKIYRDFYGSLHYFLRVKTMVGRYPAYRATFENFLSEVGHPELIKELP